jgi:hypothetical protein
LKYEKSIYNSRFRFSAYFFKRLPPHSAPIFTEKDLTYDPKLIGKWKTDNREASSNYQSCNGNSIELPGNISSIKQKGYLISYHVKMAKLPSGILLFLHGLASISILIISLPIKKKPGRSMISSKHIL